MLEESVNQALSCPLLVLLLRREVGLAEDPTRDVHEQAGLRDAEAVRRRHESDRAAAGHRQTGAGSGRRGHQSTVAAQLRATHAASLQRHQPPREYITSHCTALSPVIFQ